VSSALEARLIRKKKKEPIGFGRSSWMKRIHFPIFPLNHFITNGFSESPAAFSTLG